jgi:hypothetical protein
MQDNRKLDALLDEALASYVDAEPDPSLRVRITARAAQVATRQSLRIWAFGTTAAVTATLALALVLLRPHAPSPSVAGTAPVMKSAVHAPSSAVEDPALHPAIERAHTAKTARRGRRLENAALERSRFTASDDALTEEDRILLKFVAEHPKEAQQLLAPPPPQPVQIKPITIPPIEIADLSASGQPEESEHGHSDK